MFTISRAGKNEFKMNKRGEMKENRSDRISKLKQDTRKPCIQFLYYMIKTDIALKANQDDILRKHMVTKKGLQTVLLCCIFDFICVKYIRTTTLQKVLIIA